MKIKQILASGAVLAGMATNALAHPLDGLTADEYRQINQILKDSGTVTDETLFPLIELKEPPKADVLAWTDGDALDRKAMVQFTTA
ncbi:MAG: tyramine oxidase, partial [Pseudomonadota bacterium]